MPSFKFFISNLFNPHISSFIESICLQISGVSTEKFMWLSVAKLELKPSSNCSNLVSFLVDHF